jgi:hypothetical protein
VTSCSRKPTFVCFRAPDVVSATVGTRNATAEICAANLQVELAGQPLAGWVNSEVAGE